MKRKRVLLVDGNNLGFRGYCNPLTTSQGHRVEVVFLGLRMLQNYLAKFKPDGLWVMWDGGLDPRRTSRFDGYKAKERTPEEEAERQEIYKQMKLLGSVLNRMGLLQSKLLYREADDVIYSITERLKTKPYDFIVVSTDRDYFQMLSNEHVRLYIPTKQEVFGREKAEEELGLSIEQYPFYKALVGGHDAIPGVHGIGPVKATKILTALPSLGGAGYYSQAMDVIEGLTKSEIPSIADILLWVDLSRFLMVPLEDFTDSIYGARFREDYMTWARNTKKLFDRLEFASILSIFVDFATPFWEALAGNADILASWREA